jgi:hypothetical protein
LFLPGQWLRRSNCGLIRILSLGEECWRSPTALSFGGRLVAKLVVSSVDKKRQKRDKFVMSRFGEKSTLTLWAQARIATKVRTEKRVNKVILNARENSEELVGLAI